MLYQHLFVHIKQRNLALFKFLILLDESVHSERLLIERERLRFVERLQFNVVVLELLVDLEELRVVGLGHLHFELVFLLG